jgi:hypothetical protein
LELRIFCPDILPDRQLLLEPRFLRLRGAHDFVGNQQNQDAKIK